MDIKEFAEKAIEADKEAWQNGNFTLLEELEHPNMVIHMPLNMPDMVGSKAHKQQIIEARKNYSDIKQEWEYLTGDGNLMVISYKASFRVGEKMPVSNTPLARNFTSDEIIVMRVQDGKIVEGWGKGQFTFPD